jgi:hypothetical protein
LVVSAFALVEWARRFFELFRALDLATVLPVSLLTAAGALLAVLELRDIADRLAAVLSGFLVAWAWSWGATASMTANAPAAVRRRFMKISSRGWVRARERESP